MNEHYTTTNLQAALVGDLPANDEESLERHLASCDECSAAMERLAGEPAWRAEAAALLADDELDARAVARRNGPRQISPSSTWIPLTNRTCSAA